MDNKHHLNPQYINLKDLEHLSSCNYCSQQFADYVETHELLTAPKHMQESILMRSRQLDVQVIAKSNYASKKLQLFYYSLKVSFAAVFALGLLLWSPYQASVQKSSPTTYESRISAAERIHNRTKKITDIINDVSNQLFQMEVPFYDKQEK